MSRKLFTLFVFLLLPAAASFSQTKTKTGAAANVSPAPAIKSSAAYAELLLRQTERSAELEQLLLDYTEEYPKVKEIRYELGLLDKEMNKISATSSADAGKLTLALGKLAVRKIELEVDLWSLRMQYKDDQAEVRRARRKVEVYEKAVREILP